MDLYYTIVSPPSRSVLLLAKQLDIELNLKPVNLAAGEHKTEEFLKMNPQHCVPTLRTEAELRSGSRTPSCFTWPSGSIGTGRSIRRIWSSEPWFSSDSASICPLAMGSGAPGEDVLKQVDVALELLEGFLAKSKFVAGDSLTVADFAIINSVTVVSTLKHDMGKYPNVIRWMELCKTSMKSYEEINNQALEAWKERMAAKKN